ncbi:hypothetical protein ASB65_25500 [Agrobacterium tumefaciens str. B6]|nr:hypothetical protein ASB65_25500 [Agrobacterium tumefaciens str. B6]OCJ34503.1 hypothetical protein A6U90_25915 [Agrobacterium tumefaciens]
MPGSGAKRLWLRLQFQPTRFPPVKMVREKRPGMEPLLTGRVFLGQFAEGRINYNAHPLMITAALVDLQTGARVRPKEIQFFSWH